MIRVLACIAAGVVLGVALVYAALEAEIFTN